MKNEIESACLEHQGKSGSLLCPLEPAEQWAALPKSRTEECEVTPLLLDKTKQAYRRVEGTYLFQFLAVAFPQHLSSNSARKAIRYGHVHIEGCQVVSDNMMTPPAGVKVVVHVASVDSVPQNLTARLRKFNMQSKRAEAQIRILFQDLDAGWAVVNKPVGMHSNPNPTCYGKEALTFQDYLPALLPPPRLGKHCRSPKVCHRLDFRVSGPMVVATSLEAEWALTKAFEEHTIQKEYRAIVCGAIGEPGRTFKVVAPVDGQSAETQVEVLRVVPCIYFGKLSELRLWPITGRRQQLRKHCAIELGMPIVNEELALFNMAAPAWEIRNSGASLPDARRRGSGKLFLEAIEVTIPSLVHCFEGMPSCITTVSKEPSQHFQDLLDNAVRCFAWEQALLLTDKQNSHDLRRKTHT